MSDKDQLTFADDDDFLEIGTDERNEAQKLEMGDDEEFPGTGLDDQNEPQELDLNGDGDFTVTDLNSEYAVDEYAAEEPVEEVHSASGGYSRMQVLLMALLLVAVVAAGAYYFMDLGGTKPSVAKVPATKSVALPPQPAETPAALSKVESEVIPVSVPVPPQPAEPVAQLAPATQPDAVASPPATPATEPEEKIVEEKPKEAPVTQSVALPVPQSQPASVATETAPAASPAEAPTEHAEPPMQVAGGTFALDVGSYLLESNRDSLVAKIKKLGYEPVITPVHATLDMTRLRLGTYGKDEVQKALDFARSIEPGSYSAPAGDRYVIYAGTFLKANNVDKLSQRFLEEGITVHPEPVQVVRTLSRIYFGSFATKEDAAAAARAVGEAGLTVAVVKVK